MNIYYLLIKKMKNSCFLTVILLILLTCILSQNKYNELYRPQIHFSPAKNWINDPNGLVFYNGIYHLYFQYNPEGNVWGNMSWGHATSPDLIHWEEQPVAIYPYELGYIFSGSCIVDKDNTAGYGANVLFAIYTTCDLKIQQQAIAYSLDEGHHFTNYPGNPVIPNDDDNLRDPKVFWYEKDKKWIMPLAKGNKKGLEFYASTNLKEWEHLSTFFMEFDIPNLQWECPDLIQLDYKDKKKWVLIVNVNPRGGILGSGTMYFIGDFDGKTFTADPLDYPIWFDYGMDNYAGVTWSNTGERKILIGWMNNWLYGEQVPCSPWRSAMTLPRELKLIEYENRPILANKVVEEIDKIAKSWQKVDDEFEPGSAYQLKIQISLDKNTAVTLSNKEGQKFVFEINSKARKIIVYRNELTGKSDFNESFIVNSLEAPLNVFGHAVTLDIFVDQSSVEIFTENGSMSMTNLVFPSSIYNRLSVNGATFSAQMRNLKSIWN
jgi:fructan beta-fructosidase